MIIVLFFYKGGLFSKIHYLESPHFWQKFRKLYEFYDAAHTVVITS